MRKLMAIAFAQILVACSSGDSASGGAGGHGATGTGTANGGGTGTSGGSGGGRSVPMSCDGVVNAKGPPVDLAWPAASNVGHDAVPGDTVHFHWTGSHNVLEVATFQGQIAPTPTLGDAMWPGEITSGAKTNGGEFDWNTGTFPCGYRPGIYFFVDENNPQGGIVSVSFTDSDASHYAPLSCSKLSSPDVYEGAYAKYADRKGCTLYEVNDFQTEAHFDWVQPIFVAKQGDLVLFRWTGEHNIVQVHDVTQDMLVPGGLTSGAKTNCVGGPKYTCVNGSGEFLFDTTGYHPGIIHISDECALACTGHTTGMNMEIDLRYDVPNDTPQAPVPGSCCAIDKSKGKDCRVVEITNANDGAQLDYNVPIGRGDLVRFTWAGSLKIYQAVANANGSPSMAPKAGGLAMANAVECVPGPNLSCLGKKTEVEFEFDVEKAVAAGQADMNAQGQYFFDFYATGENTSGFTSQNSGTILYVDDSIPYDPHPTPCP